MKLTIKPKFYIFGFLVIKRIKVKTYFTKFIYMLIIYKKK